MTATMSMAIGQSPAGLDGPEARIDWLRTTAHQAADNGADLLLLPELFATGYNVGEAIVTHAQARDGDFANRVSQLCKTHNIAIAYGYAEDADGVIYNAAQCIDRSGKSVGHHRKLAIPPGFEGTYFSASAGTSLFDLCGMRVAILICYDAEFPETVRHVAQQGAQLVLVPTALGAQWGVVADTVMPTRAFENGVYLAYANSAGHENGMDFLGGSVIAAPDGSVLAKAGDKPELIYAQIDASAVTAAQTRLPYLSDVGRIRL